MSGVQNLCDHPIVIGYCVTKWGPRETAHGTNTPEPKSNCDPENPMPKVLGYVSFPRKGREEPVVMTTANVNGYYYWAFTCVP